MKVDYNELKIKRCMCIGDPVTAALVSGGVNALGNILGFGSNRSTNKTNLKIAQMNNEFNERMLQKQIDYNTEMWNKENEYNTATAQRQRLEAAGLNPNLMMNGGSAGTASSAGAVSPPSASEVGKQEAFNPDFSGIGSAVQTAVAQKMQQEVNYAQIQKLNEDANRERINNQYLAAKNIAEIGGMIANAKDSNASAALKDIQRSLQEQTFSSDVKYKQHEAEAMEWNALSAKTTYFLKQKELAVFDEKFRYDVALTLADINQKYADGHLSREQALTEAKKRVKLTAETDGVRLSNRQFKQIMPFAVKKAVNDAYKYGDNPWQSTTMFGGMLMDVAQPYLKKAYNRWREHDPFWRVPRLRTQFPNTTTHTNRTR